MRAVRVLRNGPPVSAIAVEDAVPVPDPLPGTVRVAVRTAALNFGDIARCKGGVAAVSMPPPFTLGMEACGVVEAAGEGAQDWVGRRVVAMTAMSLGGLAEQALAPVTGVFDAPPELDDVEAAAFLLPFHTSYLALQRRAHLTAGETLLVVGGASAVGTAAIQLGVAAGAKVIAVAGGAEKTELCRSLGAELVIDSRRADHTADDLVARVMEHTGDSGADVVFDVVGGEQTETLWRCIAYEGRYIPVGFNDDPQSGLTGRSLRKVSSLNITVVGVLLAYTHPMPMLRQMDLSPHPPSVGAEVHAALLELVASGKVRPVVGRTVGMGDVAAALDDHERRRTSGRTVVRIAS